MSLIPKCISGKAVLLPAQKKTYYVLYTEPIKRSNDDDDASLNQHSFIIFLIRVHMYAHIIHNI